MNTFHPNFLPAPIKERLPWRIKRLHVGGSWRERFIWLGVLILFVLIIVFGYPTVDAVYRGFRIYPLTKQVKQTAQSGDYAKLYPQLQDLRHQLANLSADAKSLYALRFIPGVGPQIKHLYYTAKGGQKTLDVFLPVAQVISTHQHINDLDASERDAIVTHLATQTDNLTISANMLKLGETSWTPQALKDAQPVLQRLAYISPELPNLLGVNGEKKYLVLFANNLEIRPGGGFIGSYAIVTVKDGNIANVDVHDSYDLPGAANTSLGPTAPAVVQRYLGVVGFNFRDSNWSPDYPTDAQAAKAAYIREGGLYNNQISGVVMVTTEILRKLLGITGPVDVNGQTFSQDNAIQKLEEQVEINFRAENIPVNHRKDVVGQLAKVLKDKTDVMSLSQKIEIAKAISDMAQTKQAAFYFDDSRLQSLFAELHWDGQVSSYTSDTLMVVDANLGGYKTEPVMTKSYDYSVTKQNGQAVAHLTITYQHRGQFNPLVSNYRTYVRVYVPQGSKLTGSNNTGGVDVSAELNRTVFGSLVLVPIGQEKTISFDYILPGNIAGADDYNLQYIKQLGAYPVNLHLTYTSDNVKKQISDTPETNKAYQF